MLEIVFPERDKQKYYDIHFKYILNIFKYLNYKITFEKRPWFTVTINGKDFLFDYADTSNPAETTLPMFKLHCIEEKEGVIPFSPVSFYDWELYYKLEKEIKYKHTGHISYRQRDYGTAIARRKEVRDILKALPGIKTELCGQGQYWSEIKDCLVSIFVPGAFNNMLDRGHWQYMAFGSVTISPRLPEMLPFGNKLTPYIHYVKCEDDYSDLLDKIDFCRSNPMNCINISKNAKELFQEVGTPEALGKWIESRI